MEPVGGFKSAIPAEVPDSVTLLLIPALPTTGTILNARLRYLQLLAPLAMFVAVCAEGATPIDFNRDIRPILSNACFHCHGPDANHREADLRFDVETDAKADLGGYHAIVPNNPDESELFARIVTEDEDDKMPPVESGKTISAEQVDLLKRWIAEGAVWSGHWAYEIPERQAPPSVKQSAWPASDIDKFLLASLEAQGIEPSQEAESVTLVRRLYFDLTGLPPEYEEVQRFAENSSPQAYEDLVDQLLASPRFGERMAMYWLDLVRYADTVGYHGDQDHNISPYRDYVIDAFNDNMPFDQFTREQLAGDLLPNPTISQQVATGYNRLLQTSHEGGVQRKEYLAIYAADRVRNVSGVWMGATVGCAQCHDHKYDPYTTKDFYSMAAFFADVDELRGFSEGRNALPTPRPPEIRVYTQAQQQRLDQVSAELAALEEKAKAAGTEKDETLEKKIAATKEARKSALRAGRLTMVTKAVEPRTMRILPRGNWLDETGPIVEPAVPAFLGEIAKDGQRATRLDLANWFTDVEQGVGGQTARVFANRLWYLLFGTGISRSLDDLGGQGEPPTHPELLDLLAIEFVESGWNVKQLVKSLVMTRAYRQSSLQSDVLREVDPYNRLVARQSRFRLPAETIRDNALAISGLLIEEQGGDSVKPYQPEGYYRHLNFPQRKYKHHNDARQWRRGVYMHWQRQFLHPMLKAFDAPSREECTASRSQSNTPLAALTLLNDPTFVETGRVFAAKILVESGETDDDKFRFAFRRAVSRDPDAYERRLLGELLQQQREHYTSHQEEAERLLTGGLATLPEGLDRVELASWTIVARTILNLHETITRN